MFHLWKEKTAKKKKKKVREVFQTLGGHFKERFQIKAETFPSYSYSLTKAGERQNLLFSKIEDH